MLEQGNKSHVNSAGTSTGMDETHLKWISVSVKN